MHLIKLYTEINHIIAEAQRFKQHARQSILHRYYLVREPEIGNKN